MSDDHLSNEIAVAGELTDTGVKASVRSRAISAFDRLVGAAVDVMNAHVEGFAERKRAKNRGEVAMIEQITRYGVEQLGADPDLAQRAVEKHFRKVISQQENIEAVVREAHADLIDGNQDYEDVPGDIAAEFFDKFEQYSASASTDELRHRWGRVLASEIRKPGTFSTKVLRVVDELDQETALLFERVCKYRVDRTLYKPVMDDPLFLEKASLVSAGLMVDPGTSGQIKIFSSGANARGEELLMNGCRSIYFSVPKDLLKTGNFDKLVVRNKDDVGAPVYVLTEAGEAISSILPDNSEQVIRNYARMLSHHVEARKIVLYRPTDGGLVPCGYAEQIT